MVLNPGLPFRMAALIAAGMCFLHCTSENVDIIVIGGGTSGTAASIQAARCGADVLLVEETEWLGGMLTSAGVSATDGCFNLRGGFWAEFRDSLEAWYGGAEALKTGWVSKVMFEPSVGNRIFKNMAAREHNLSVRFNTKATGFERTSRGWKVMLDGPSGRHSVNAKILVDATELGDVAKYVGIPYKVGMDASSETGESIAPERGNSIVQDLTYVMILKDYGHPVPVPEPDDYSPSEFACCCANQHCRTPKEANRVWSMDRMITYGKLPGGKYMINWPCEGNDFYSAGIIEASSAERAEEFAEAKRKSLRFLYFLQHELGFVNLNLADDEYPTADGFPFIPYYRESRRTDGQVKFTVNHINDPYGQPDKLYRTGIAVGDYPIDQHHAQYSGWEELPNLYFCPIPSYSLPAGVMMPKKYDNMLVIEKSISVTNLVNGTTRLQPVVLQLGQAAGVVAALAVETGCGVSEVSVREVQSVLLDAGAYLVPLLDLQPDSPYFKALQRIALTGIIRYTGLNVAWSNQTWLYAERPMLLSDLLSGLKEFYEGKKRPDGTAISFDVFGSETSCGHVSAGSVSTVPVRAEDASCEIVDVAALSRLMTAVSGTDASECEKLVISCLSSSFGREYAASSALSRLECAVAIDTILDPFDKFDVDLRGNLMMRQ